MVGPAEGDPEPGVAPKKRDGRPKWEVDARARLRTAIRRARKPLQVLAERNANEGDTRLLVTDFLCDGLGFEKYADLTTEYQVRGEFADYGIRIDHDLIALVEVKRINTKLNARHLRQVESYAVNEGVAWMLLTNGAQWRAYHLSAGMPIAVDLAIDVDLLAAGTPSDKADELFYLTRESLKRRQIEDLWKAKAATSPGALADILRSEKVLDEIRKAIRRQSGQRVTVAELRQRLDDTVIRADLASA